MLKKNRWLFVLALLMILFMVIGTSAGYNSMGKIQNAIATPLNYVQGVIYNAASKIEESFKFIVTLDDVKQENVELKVRVQELESELSKIEYIKERNQELEEMLNFNSEEYELLGGEVFGYSGNSYADGLLLNVGANHGVEQNMIAITSNGVVGQVVAVESTWSKVQTFANENVAIAGAIKETGEVDGIVSGVKDVDNKQLVVLEIPNLDSEVEIGDTVITSGVGRLYPKGIEIGKVIEIEYDNSKIATKAYIEPSVELNKLDEVFLIKPIEDRNLEDENSGE